MSAGRLAEVALAAGGTLHGEDRSFVDVSTDTRSLQSGQLYVALRGPNFDGHDFVARAAELGAAAALVERAVDVPLPQVVVANTRAALGAYAAAWRARFAIDVVAVTGSNGKTGVKEMLAAILQRQGPTLATRGNFNNDIGVPLTLLRLNRQHRYAAIEIGASGPGEVAALAALARPRVGIVTNAAPAHLEGFGSVEAVAHAKGEMYGALEEDGTAVINADDAYADLWRDLAAGRPIVTFGESDAADVSLRNFSQRVNGRAAHIEFDVVTPDGTGHVHMPVGGRHNARNALAALAATHALGIGLDDALAALETVDPVSGRLQVLSALRGARVIDDSYNANPASTRAAIDFLAEQAEPGWLVLGDMAELGEEAGTLHAQIGKRARERGIERLYAVGELSRSAAVAFGSGGRWFESTLDLRDALTQDLRSGVNVLVKASRSMRLEQVVAALRAGGDSANAQAEN